MCIEAIFNVQYFILLFLGPLRFLYYCYIRSFNLLLHSIVQTFEFIE